jgi:RNA polymerase primary sigma factor
MDTPLGNEKSDLDLIKAVIRKETGAWDRFVQRYSDLVYSYCSSVFSDQDLEAEYLNVFRCLQADSFATLREFEGRAKFSTYLTVTLGKILERRIVELFKLDQNRGWNTFQRFFKKVLNRLKRENEDLYQDICIQLIDNNYRRIVGFDGRGSFAGYIRRVIDNLCLDLRRQSEGRRRLPEAVQRLPALEQKIYRQLHWNGSREKDLPDILRDEMGSPYTPQRIDQALAQLRNTPLRQVDSPVQEISLVSVAGDGEEKERELADSTYAPETLLVDAEEERADERHYSALKEALNGLPAELQLYVRLRFYSNPPKSPKEITRLMGRSEREIYRIRQQAISVLKMALKERGVGKNPDLSV